LCLEEGGEDSEFIAMDCGDATDCQDLVLICSRVTGVFNVYAISAARV